MVFSAHVLTLFPELFPGALGHSITGRALKEGHWHLQTTHIRDFATDKHRTVDDTPYGGGAGMVMRPDVVAASIRHARKHTPNVPVVYLCPQGERFSQPVARELAQGQGLIILCGHYEGIDERVLETDVDRRISLGDFVLTGGEVAVFPLLDAIVRLRPNVLGAEASLHEESFDMIGKNGQPLLEYPHYTRPPVWEGKAVPEVLTSGHHAHIQKWRQEMAEQVTLDRNKT